MSNKIKTKPELLKAFKKANKVRRKVLATRAGFSTPKEYRDFLEEQILRDMQNGQETRKTVHNVNLLDVSGSMTFNGNPSKFKAAIIGMKEELETLRGVDDGVDYIQTYITFSNTPDYKVHINRRPINDDMNLDFSVRHGGTALFDAIVDTVESIIENQKEGEKTVLSIFTDGGEAHSTKSNRTDAAKAVAKAEDAGIVVTFIGTERDTKNIVKVLRIDSSNTLVHNNTSEQVAEVFATRAAATRSYSASVVAGTDSLTGYYKQQGEL